MEVAEKCWLTYGYSLAHEVPLPALRQLRTVSNKSTAPCSRTGVGKGILGEKDGRREEEKKGVRELQVFPVQTLKKHRRVLLDCEEQEGCGSPQEVNREWQRCAPVWTSACWDLQGRAEEGRQQWEPFYGEVQYWISFRGFRGYAFGKAKLGYYPRENISLPFMLAKRLYNRQEFCEMLDPGHINSSAVVRNCLQY
ncbi:hypothetical protein EK904_001551 [Melospiza melodia maxima]|nr:hypothetical protein EK904_001551 [Melospiza melodia maxima]